MPNWSDFEKYLRGDMLPLNKSITVTIERVTIEKTHPQPNGPAVSTPILYFKGKRLGMPLKTKDTRALRTMFGDDTEACVGKQIVIRAEKKKVGGEERTPIYIYPASKHTAAGELTEEPPTA